MSFNDGVRVQIVKLATFKLIRAANFEKSFIAGFWSLLSAVAPNPTELIILVANAGCILA
jgi:hypothetical protein